MITLEYIWIDGKGELRSKTKVLKALGVTEEITIEIVPEWNYDGSSCYQTSTENSEILIKPQRIFNDPFRKEIKGSYLVLCDTYHPNGSTHISNTRYNAAKIFDANRELEPLYGLEQEFL